MQEKTAVLLIDPLNEFLHPEGKIYPTLQASIEATDTVTNLQRFVKIARSNTLPILYCQHQLFEEGVYDDWKHMSKSQLTIQQTKAFTVGSFGAEIMKGLEPDKSNGDAIVSRHWNSSSFANTDLDYQLRQRDITHVVVAGMVANTCLESTARYAVEMGYHVTIIADATAGFSIQLKEAAEKIIWPTIVDEVLHVDEWAAKLNKKA
ncbi:Isochorismatase hydrolase [Trichoderma citrinoviride]|uniref:Isochorismatase hydrolase n=1 Tax=Trichoderma citrinoviride TaxID=58853 RepID=A0A2T4B717_9HYPO|nr:Isochorismatase hydrolase [Trichoderma citrinoviride]PTB65117.1 Isochorismatase hydrolase [Trichoderma citrinoviride]